MSKGTDQFKQVIQAHLNSLADQDKLFAVTLKKKNKNINDCITYILTEVKKSGNSGFDDDEIFGMAVHYYDEDDIKVGKRPDARIVSNHKIEGTVKSEQKKPEKKKLVPTKEESKPIVVQTSLF